MDVKIQKKSQKLNDASLEKRVSRWEKDMSKIKPDPNPYSNPGWYGDPGPESLRKIMLELQDKISKSAQKKNSMQSSIDGVNENKQKYVEERRNEIIERDAHPQFKDKAESDAYLKKCDDEIRTYPYMQKMIEILNSMRDELQGYNRENSEAEIKMATLEKQLAIYEAEKDVDAKKTDPREVMKGYDREDQESKADLDDSYIEIEKLAGGSRTESFRNVEAGLKNILSSKWSVDNKDVIKLLADVDQYLLKHRSAWSGAGKQRIKCMERLREKLVIRMTDNMNGVMAGKEEENINSGNGTEDEKKEEIRMSAAQNKIFDDVSAAMNKSFLISTRRPEVVSVISKFNIYQNARNQYFDSGSGIKDVDMAKKDLMNSLKTCIRKNEKMEELNNKNDDLTYKERVDQFQNGLVDKLNDALICNSSEAMEKLQYELDINIPESNAASKVKKRNH